MNNECYFIKNKKCHKGWDNCIYIYNKECDKMTSKRFTIQDERVIKDNQKYVTENGYVFSYKSDAEEVCNLLNELHEEKEQLLSDKEHLMGCLIRFFGYDDEDIDYNLNRESNRDYGKQYYEMKEEDW